MLIDDFCALGKRLCEIIGTEAPDLAPDEDGAVTFAVKLDDVNITIGFDPQRSSARAFVLVAMGALPETHREAALLNLMEANFFMLNDQGRTFSLDPENGNVLLQYSHPCASAEGTDLYQKILQDVGVAHQWRNDYAIDTGRPSAGPEDDNAIITRAIASALFADRVYS